MHRKTHFTETPIKPMRVYEEMNAVVPARHDLRVDHRPEPDRRRAVPARATARASGSTAARPARSAGRSPRRSACVAADPTRTVVGLSGDYDFQFLIEELAVGAQFRLPYVQVLVNNSYLGLIRQAQRGFEMDYCVQLAFENQNVDEPTAVHGYGVDHQAVVAGLGCKSLRVTDPEQIRAGAGARRRRWRASTACRWSSR